MDCYSKTTFTSPRWANLTVAIIGIVLGAISFIDSFSLFTIANQHWLYALIGVLYIAVAALFITFGIIGCVKSKDAEKALRTDYHLGAIWCGLATLINLFTGILYLILAQNYGVVLFVIALIIAGVYLATTILLLIAASRFKNTGDFKGIGKVGSIFFISITGFSLLMLFISGGSALVYLIDIALVVMAVFTLVSTVKSDYVTVRYREEEVSSN